MSPTAFRPAPLVLIVFTLLLTGRWMLASAADNIVFEDFEGQLQGWTATGDAFRNGPVEGTLPNQGKVTGFHGKKLVNSFLGGDAPQGTLTSPAFTIPRRYIELLVGGGNRPGVCEARLIVGGAVRFTATGNNSERLTGKCWDVTNYIGQQAAIQIVDQASDGWGHVLVDDIVFTDGTPTLFGANDTPDALKSLLAASPGRINEVDAQGNAALHTAAEHDLAGTIRLLVGLGADPLVRNAAGQTPRDVALANDAAAAATALEDAENAMPAPPGSVWLEMLDRRITVANPFRPPLVRRALVGGDPPLKLRGRTYAHGIGAHSTNEWVCELKGKATRLVATVGIDDAAETNGSARVTLFADGAEVADSGDLRGNAPPVNLDVDLSGRQTLTVRVDDCGDGHTWDVTDFGGAALALTPDLAAYAAAANGDMATLRRLLVASPALLSAPDPLLGLNLMQWACFVHRMDTMKALAVLGAQIGIVQPGDRDPAPMVFVPGGEFTIGGDAVDDAPRQNLKLASFYMDECEVTTERYARFLNAVGNTRDERGEWFRPGRQCLLAQVGGRWQPKAGFDQYPMVGVSWYGAAAFAQWAGKRLPSEAEWERAARGNDQRAYPWGVDSLNFEPANCEESRIAEAALAKVGAYPDGVSPYGCQDMVGNAAEWTNSLYKPYPYDAQDGREDPAAPGPRVQRGGAWCDTFTPMLTVHGRQMTPPQVRNPFVGFRCARSVQ